MKKTIIAGVAASVLAAMPVLGAFAATESAKQVTDTINLTIQPHCMISYDTDKDDITVSMNNATAPLKSDIAGSTMSITCNAGDGWHLTAEAKGGQTALTGDGEAIAAGTATSGETSNWAFKLAGDDVKTNADGVNYTSFNAITTEAKTVAGGDAPVSGSTITATYQIFLSATQEAGTYTGGVTYKLVENEA